MSVAQVVPGGPHILVIDDDPELLALYRELLCEEGYRVTLRDGPPASPAETVALRPDLIILDTMVGGEQAGFGYLRELKADRLGAEIPVIVCSAALRRSGGLDAELAGIDCCCVSKPFDIEHLLAEVRLGLRDDDEDQAAS